jgi:hypothetical protein
LRSRPTGEGLLAFRSAARRTGRFVALAWQSI